jgi:MarR family transcriptional regulator, transcriptional regulator for hemolysin
MTTKATLNGRLDILNTRLRAQEKDITMDNFLKFLNTADMVLNYLDSQLREVGLNRTQISILVSLVVNGGTMLPTQLSYIVLRSKYATIKAIDGLEKLKMVTSERSNIRSKVKSDRRLRKVTITEKGIEVLENTMADRHRLSSDIMGGMNKKELGELKSMLSQINLNILSLADIAKKQRDEK